ncbi:mechanosensitive ion channel family protein [Butyrivibrio sp. WCD3002]|uniref:mechanosensitive ion channel family protein n=1 Tax=Butyrivibrio sp. WCD3002 TaxID=1280676 RepID=UPI0004108D2C|nr:mechanosensitive ion channel domain-containing protein [Butyrivibrio sp. WCD3002]
MNTFITEIFETHKDEIMQYLSENPGGFLATILIIFLITILLLGFYFFIGWVCLKISKKIFASIEKKKGKKIHIQFAESLVKLAIIIIFVVIPLGGDKIGHSLLGSAAVLAAVVGFAAQDVIKDILAGIQISVYKPFDLGDRIELPDGTSGIVERITMRHIELRLIDTIVLMIPNSTINTETIKNYSYDYVPRSVQFSFPVDYKSDIKKAKQVIFDAIEESPYSYPGKKAKNGEMIYGPVYFIAIDDSSLCMKVTVYFKPGTATEVIKDDINTRVFEALTAAGIEIPYPYTSVVMQK